MFFSKSYGELLLRIDFVSIKQSRTAVMTLPALIVCCLQLYGAGTLTVLLSKAIVPAPIAPANILPFMMAPV